MKNIMPLPLLFMVFDKKPIIWDFECFVLLFVFSYVGNALFLSSWFQDFCSVFSFQMLNYHVSWRGFFRFILFRIYLGFWICRFMFVVIFGNFQPWCLLILLQHLSLFLSFWNASDTQVGPLVVVPFSTSVGSSRISQYA